ncbi:MAG: cytochrome-c oxidase, cbb3-type subunit III [Pseudomonadota bacterium]
MSTSNPHHDGPEINAPTGTETTGHEWDGIKELNNPLPRWWLIVFYVCCAWAFVYWIFMPSWPGINGHLRGVRQHSERINVERAMAELRSDRAALGDKLLASNSLEDIQADPELFQFAMAAGRSAFGDNCATCHGTGGQGFPGYPNLNDDVWLWGGTLDDIRMTISHGIRSSHPETRMSQMPAFGRMGLLPGQDIDDVTEFVWQLAGNDVDAASAERGALVYEAQCAACHGTSGLGDRLQGAPNLTDAEWFYGGTKRAIRSQIYDGRNGVMPTWHGRLDDTTITSLAVYVHALGGGELPEQQGNGVRPAGQ